MKFCLCSACRFFQPLLLTEEKRIPKSCLRAEYADIFGPDSGGFPSGCDIVHCDYFVQYDPFTCDVILRDQYGYMVGYVLTQARNFKLIRCPKLYDNSKNVKLHDVKIKRREETSTDSF